MINVFVFRIICILLVTLCITATVVEIVVQRFVQEYVLLDDNISIAGENLQIMSVYNLGKYVFILN